MAFNMQSVNNSSAAKLLVLAGIGTGLYFLVKKGITTAAQEDQEGKTASDQDTQQAQLLYNAMTPDAFWNFLSSTNVDAIMQIASNITDLAGVQAAYKNLYRRDLMQDLQKNLSTEHMSQFQSLVAQNTDRENAAAKATIDVYSLAQQFKSAVKSGNANTILALGKKLYHNGKQDYYKAVSLEYRSLFGKDFDTDLQTVLSADGYNHFVFEITDTGTYVPQEDSGYFNY